MRVVKHPTITLLLSSLPQLILPHRSPRFPFQVPFFFFPSIAQSPPLCNMAGESESFSTNAAADNTEYGFQRSEMYKSNLAGTVDPYDRHVFLCYSSHESWPSRVEAEPDSLPKLLSSAIKARKSDMTIKTRLTVCEQRDDLLDGDVLIFPEMILYRGLKDSEVDSFVEDVLVSGQPWKSGVQEKLTGSYVYVCAHNSRDKRCGVCGPVLIEKFKEEIESNSLKDQVFVNACSHVGGHKYAGNVIIFSAGPDGKVAGNWYGYVTPNDVLELLDKQIGQGEIIDRIWRGQMGQSAEEAENIEQTKLANGTDVINNEKQPQEVATEETTAGCCQGARGFSCCRAENVEKKEGGLSYWLGEWEQRDVLMTLAVVGAVASVAVVYGLHRRAT